MDELWNTSISLRPKYLGLELGKGKETRGGGRREKRKAEKEGRGQYHICGCIECIVQQYLAQMYRGTSSFASP